MARRLLPAGPAAAPRAGVRLAAGCARSRSTAPSTRCSGRSQLRARGTTRDARPTSSSRSRAARFITHMKKLRDVEAPLANFFASGVLALGAQARPGALAAAADPRLRRRARSRRSSRCCRAPPARRPSWPAGTTSGSTDRAWLTTDADRPLRHALEVRHDSFETPAFVELLREHDVALVVADTAGKWPLHRGRRPPTSSTCACTATRSSTSAATPTPRSTAGPRDPRLGRRRDAHRRAPGWPRRAATRPRRLRLLRQRRQGARAVRRDRAGRRGSGCRRRRIRRCRSARSGRWRRRRARSGPGSPGRPHRAVTNRAPPGRPGRSGPGRRR